MDYMREVDHEMKSDIIADVSHLRGFGFCVFIYLSVSEMSFDTLTKKEIVVLLKKCKI
jgi:hypothetical protein